MLMKLIPVGSKERKNFGLREREDLKAKNVHQKKCLWLRPYILQQNCDLLVPQGNLA